MRRHESHAQQNTLCALLSASCSVEFVSALCRGCGVQVALRKSLFASRTVQVSVSARSLLSALRAEDKEELRRCREHACVNFQRLVNQLAKKIACWA